MKFPAFFSLIRYLFLLCAVLYLLPMIEAKGDNSVLVRIAILRDADRVQIKISGSYEIRDPLENRLIEKDMGLNLTSITKGAKSLRLGEKDTFVNRLQFSAVRDVTVLVQGKERHYRGNIDVIVSPNGKLLVVNQLGIEDYIKGVLYHEVSNRWPMEALKAQAVAARSYALTQIQANLKKDFDVTNDIYSQVYGGRTSERYRTNLAVDATQGEVLIFDNKILPAFFHATCAGQTENSLELWPRQSWTPLKGVKCSFCTDSPHYIWKKNVRLKDIQNKLVDKGYQIGLIEDISITKRNLSGRILMVLITDRDGKQIIVSGKDFREILGPNFIRSNDYAVIMKGYYCDFIGKGWGHGVGLCQWGARGMSLKGFSYEEILRYYYPGVEIRVVQSVEPVKAF